MRKAASVELMAGSFSQRHSLAGPPVGVLLRDEVPPGFRMFLIDLPYKSESDFDLFEMQAVICRVLLVFPRPNGTPSYDCKKHIKECEWFYIFDIIEGLYKSVYEKTCHHNPGAQHAFTEGVNKALIENNIGWQLVNGQIVVRGDEPFEATLKTAVSALEGDAKPTAAGHLRAAIRALSARPKTNTSGAVAHATSAVECVLGEITGQAMTLGRYLDKHSSLFHPALRKGLDGLYGYASDEGARHGREGTEPARDEAEFVLATCAAVCTLLTRKHFE
jgi:hypothetical protein